jgi:NAD(P)-dependent dehydrogenase (short-subunit alcohol dehydrogenase family)
MLNVNLTGTYHCIQAVLPGMLEAAKAGTPGRIVNIASTAGLKGYAYVSAYVSAKHGVVGLTKALALELARKEKADLVLGTDPDTDRIGIIVREGENYTFFNGNQIGCLLGIQGNNNR